MAWPRSCGNAGRRGWFSPGGAPAANGELPAGYATEDGVGPHYIGTELHEAVAMRDGARAWWVQPSPGGDYSDEPDLCTHALIARRGRLLCSAGGGSVPWFSH